MSKKAKPRQFSLNRAQASAALSKTAETFLIGGVGLGKSFFLAMKLLEALSTPGVVCGLFAPSIKLLRNATMKQVQEAWKLFGFYAQTDYVMNILPPKEWNVKPYSELMNRNILTTKWGSYCLCDGLDNYDSQRGTQFDEIFVDEFRDINPDARDVLLARLRGTKYIEIGKKHRIWYATTPPDNVRYLNELLHDNSQDISFHFGGSMLNAHNLPANYVENMRLKYDELTYRREVLGELVAATNSLFFWAFNRTSHVHVAEPDYAYPVYLSFDPGTNPLVGIAAQHHNGIKVVANFVQYNADLRLFCHQFLKPFLYHTGTDFKHRFPRIFITGDPHGRDPNVVAGSTFFTTMLTHLRLNHSCLRILQNAPLHENSYRLCNSILQRHPDFKIDYKCQDLITDIESLQIVENSGPNKNILKINKQDRAIGHLSDCLRYYFQVFHGSFINIEYSRRHHEMVSEIK